MAEDSKPTVRPGFKTSEFWVTALTTVGGVLVSTGVLHPNDAANVKSATDAVAGAAGQGWIGLVIAAATNIAYIWGRTQAKK